ncbi:hypothetical protein DUNSADRAFT_11762 [Dunaliella salina]|uniref:PDEase domain-containing protein n=1 Tax=Dunaliella salina TaxID=3046 RepID=A0ABQ7GCL7_DUNSA|nr:hypothetical protein DUNSADRAFT_11762 [Dunaliella salina]|eukprot:KAF5832352.1 hypothetical protein DUNSADRAFT_11762 [Dunaliella salina]
MKSGWRLALATGVLLVAIMTMGSANAEGLRLVTDNTSACVIVLILISLIGYAQGRTFAACNRKRGVANCQKGSSASDTDEHAQHDCEARLNISQALLELLRAGKLPSDKDIAMLQELLEEAQHHDAANLLQALHAKTCAQPDVEENIMYGLGSWSPQLECLSAGNDERALGSPFQKHANVPIEHEQDTPVEDILTALLTRHSAFDPPGAQGTPLPRTAAAHAVLWDWRPGSSLGGQRRAPLARSTTFSHPVLSQGGQRLKPMTQARVLAGEEGEKLWLLPSRSVEPRQLCPGMQQTLHAICTLGGLSQAVAEPLLVLAAYLAAIVHDHEHEGVTNAFHITTGSTLAMCYNDVSPLENHHLSSSFNIIREYDFIPAMSKAEFASLRKVIVDLVLSTDMAKHLKIVGRISKLAAMVSASRQNQSSKATGCSSGPLPMPRLSLSLARKRSCDMQQQEPRLARANTHRRPVELESVSEGSQCSSKSDGLVLLELDEAKKMLLLQVALKCADLGHVAETVDVHLKWVRRLEEEFFQQGDLEKASGLPVSPLFDRKHAGISKSQEGFLNFVASPLFQALVTVLPDAHPLTTGIENNIRHWKEEESWQQQPQQQQTQTQQP